MGERKIIATIAMALLIYANLTIAIRQRVIPESHIQQFLRICNNARSKTSIPAANSKVLVWDEKIAEQMKNYTDSCWEEGPSNDPPTYFLLRDQTISIVKVATARIVNMEKFFDFDTGGCFSYINPNIKKCRHPDVYARVIEPGIERVGCGMTSGCPPLANGVTTYVACAIASDGVDPYIEGPRCSQCPAGWDYCVRGLCSKEPGTEGPTKSPITRKPTRRPTRFPTRPTRRSKAPSSASPSTGPTISVFLSPSRAPDANNISETFN